MPIVKLQNLTYLNLLSVAKVYKTVAPPNECPIRDGCVKSILPCKKNYLLKTSKLDRLQGFTLIQPANHIHLFVLKIYLQT